MRGHVGKRGLIRVEPRSARAPAWLKIPGAVHAQAVKRRDEFVSTPERGKYAFHVRVATDSPARLGLYDTMGMNHACVRKYKVGSGSVPRLGLVSLDSCAQALEELPDLVQGCLTLELAKVALADGETVPIKML